MPGKPDSPFRLLHASLIEVAAATNEFITSGLLQFTEQRPVGVVVFLDHLKGPAAVQDVSAIQLRVKPVRDLVMSRFAQPLHRLAQLAVRRTRELVERVEMAARSLACLERLRQLA